MSEAFEKVRDLHYGGSSGMGLATARLLVEDGGTVVLVARGEDKLARRLKELESFGKG
jgi:NADP-dependent 3-hydroxy acid dehydrogenase YdfG